MKGYSGERLLANLIEVAQRPMETMGLPRTLLRKHSENVQTFALIAAIAALFFTLTYTAPETRPAAWGCTFAVIIYGIIYWRMPKQLGPQARLLLHCVLAVLALVALYYVLQRYLGYPDTDPHALWVAFLVPLIIISKGGITTDWLLVALVVVLIFPGFRIYTSRAAGSSFETTLTSARMVATYGQVAFLLGVSAVVHAIVREMHYYQFVGKLENELTEVLTSEPGFHAAYLTAVRKMRREYFPDSEFAFILLWNELAQRLKVVACDGLDDSEWCEIELRDAQGITGRAFRENKTIRVPNVRRGNTSFYGPGSLSEVRSEVATPIRVGETPIGVLDVESAKARSHNLFHAAYLEAWANAIAGAYQYFQALDARAAETQRAFDEMGLLAAGDALGIAGNGHDPFYSWFRQIAEPSAEYFGADNVAIVRLAVGTGTPFLPPLIWPKKELRFLQKRMRQLDGLSEDSFIWDLSKETGVRDWSTLEQWTEWERSPDRWLREELRAAGLTTLVLVPVGTPGHPLAMFFLGYRQPKMISDLDRLMMMAFGGVIEKSLRQIFPWPSDLHRVRVSIHHQVVPHSQHLIQQTNTLSERFVRLGLSQQDADDTALLFADHLERIKMIRQLVKYATHRERFSLREMTLQQALNYVASDFVEAKQRERRIVVTVEPEIEDQVYTIREFLFWVAAEAIANAIEHGESTLVLASLRVLPGAIELLVSDNGGGLPESPDTRQPDGIYHMQRLARQVFNASLLIEDRESCGVDVSLRLPIGRN